MVPRWIFNIHGIFPLQKGSFKSFWDFINFLRTKKKIFFTITEIILLLTLLCTVEVSSYFVIVLGHQIHLSVRKYKNLQKLDLNTCSTNKFAISNNILSCFVFFVTKNLWKWMRSEVLSQGGSNGRFQRI